MSWSPYGENAAEGDLVQLLGSGYKSHFIRLKQGEEFQTHRGVIRHDDIIGEAWGKKLSSHQGNPFYLLQPGIADLVRNIKRSTQILYPKEIGMILVTMAIGPGQKILEAGTGSGGLTTAFAFFVGPQGHVYSYDRNPDFQQLAQSNLTKVGLAEIVTLKHGDAQDGFSERGMDAIFLDLPNPYDYLRQVKASLKPGGFFGTIIPTFNQASLVLKSLKIEKFAFIEMCEVLVRYFKMDWERLRPTDRMVAHTGYLVFARSVFEIDEDNEKIEEVD